MITFWSVIQFKRNFSFKYGKAAEYSCGFYCCTINMENKFNLTIYNRLKGGGEIAAELDATTDQYRKWIGVYKYVQTPKEKNISAPQFLIMEFELEKDQMESHILDVDLIMKNKKKYYVNTEEELMEKLLLLNINPNVFTYPWKCDYPL